MTFGQKFAWSCKGESSSPAVAFTPTQDYEVELSVALIHQVPSVPAK